MISTKNKEMLQSSVKMPLSIQNNMLKKIVFLFALFFGFVCGQAQQKYVIDQIVGVVGNKPIKLSDIETEYNQQRAQGYVSDNLKCEVYESLLGQKLLVNQAILDSVKVTDDQVESELNRSLNSAINQLGSVEKVEEYYHKSMSEIKEDMRESYRDITLARTLQSEIVDKIKITPSEVEEFYKKIPADSLPYINTQIEIRQLGIYPAFNEQAVLAAKEQLLDLRKRILAGEKFSVLAAMYSDDDGTRIRGGEAGFVTRAEVDPEYAKAAFALKKPGEVSRIVESRFGYHIVQLIERKGDKVNTRHILIKPKPDPNAVKRALEILDSIAMFIRLDSINFDKAVAFYSQDEETRNNGGLLVNNATGGTRFDLDQQLSPADYNAIKKLKVGEMSTPYESRDKNGKVFYKIVKLQSVIPAHRANLKDDYNMIQEYAKNQKKNKVLEDWFVDKQEAAYIYVDQMFQDCNFRSKGWMKNKI
jgi:peptidyl-prolyl cis-trans isomerase SurA